MGAVLQKKIGQIGKLPRCAIPHTRRTVLLVVLAVFRIDASPPAAAPDLPRRTDMARYTFSTDFDYPARLHSVLNRPVENNGLFLLRLEFEVFQRFSENVIRSTGKVACRDLVVGKGLDATKDQGLWPYIQALGVPSPNNSQSWLNLHQARKPTWVQIQFAHGPRMGFWWRNIATN